MTPTTTFTTTLALISGQNTGIVVPDALIEEWGVGKRPPVIVNVNGFEYRSTVAPMGGRFLLPFSADKRKSTGLAGGDEITVTLTHDPGERTVEVPDDLAAAMDVAGVRSAFDAQSFTNRKEQARSITDAKKPETRERRIAAVVAKLSS
ncbi:YdeI/OmpD-associated family protein [Microbacterium gorillae]|uniref:YdeI/OmpD-associated family protein n=1 Tax=Microbacterium gorillae TaxID=1231063 RepID=UPI00058BFC31|nr:YdeI/OmpD-associated family protein [Microbacterium gorillae]